MWGGNWFYWCDCDFAAQLAALHCLGPVAAIPTRLAVDNPVAHAAWILFVRIYEERELEIRFGESYLRYKARTPFF